MGLLNLSILIYYNIIITNLCGFRTYLCKYFGVIKLNTLKSKFKFFVTKYK